MIINSIVGKGSIFKGDLEAEELIRVEGDYTGMIKNDNGEIILSQSSRFKGSIYSENLTISGLFKGSVYVSNKLFISSSAVVIGSINTRFLEVSEGAILSIDVSMEDRKIEGSSIKNKRNFENKNIKLKLSEQKSGDIKKDNTL